MNGNVPLMPSVLHPASTHRTNLPHTLFLLAVVLLWSCSAHQYVAAATLLASSKGGLDPAPRLPDLHASLAADPSLRRQVTYP